MYSYFKTFVEGISTYISSWESKGLSNEKISSINTSNYNQAPKLVYNNARTKLNFSTDLLKQDKATFNRGPIVNIYIVYNFNIDKYKYSAYSIGFDSRGTFSHPSRGDGKNVVVFGCNLKNSKHVNNKQKTF